MNAMTEKEDTRNPAQAEGPAHAEGEAPAFAAQGGSAAGAAPEAATRTAKPLPEDALIIVPVRNMVLFPGVLIPITIGRARSIAAAQSGRAPSARSACCCSASREVERAGPDDLYRVGTTRQRAALRHRARR